MLKLIVSSQFKKDLKKAAKQGKNKVKLVHAISLLQQQKNLPKRYRDHDLIGNWKGYRECHIEPDWLLIYKISEESVKLARTGTTQRYSKPNPFP